jgi:tetratricopeptide (TPR) repeat protein
MGNQVMRMLFGLTFATFVYAASNGSDTAKTVTAYSNLAAASIRAGDNQRAEEYARQALEMAQSDLPARHRLTAVALNNLAQSCRFQEKYLEAEVFYRRAIEIWEDALGADHPDLARGLMNLAALYHERGRETGAEDLYLRAAVIFEIALGKTTTEALVVRNELADVLRAERRYTEAAKLARATLSVMQNVLPEDDPRLQRARYNFARLQQETIPAKPKVKTFR